MAGIYLHIPFCKQACHYCNFHFSTSLLRKNELLEALLKEIDLQLTYLEAEPVETIYFGGGTPSLLETDEVKLILDKINDRFNVTKDAEITLETNPDDINDEKLYGWKKAGVNRLSIGIQSFFDEDLVWMNRAHSASQAHSALRAVGSLQSAVRSFSNITIDLIYGLPGLTNERWKYNVDQAISFGISHLSCYALTVEAKTPLKKMIEQKRSADVDPDKQSEQFLLLMSWMEEAGYEHYEISNFAKPGFRSRHNSSYWQGKKYLGLGPSAHSFNSHSRQWNVSNNVTYIENISRGILPVEKEELDVTQQLNEYIMTSLRTIEGLDLNNMSVSASNRLLLASKKFLENDLMKIENDHLVLTKEGKLLADGIAADLFF